MTVTYTAEVATSGFATFIRLLARWRGSIYKLLWRELALFILSFYGINFIYRFALSSGQKRTFEKVALYCEGYNNLIPVAFVLGFYVSIIIKRWWDQFNLIPWPDRLAVFVTATVHGHDDRGRLMRRTIMRYCCLSYVFTFASISSVVKKRFPTLDHITDAGFMSKEEQKVIEQIQTAHNKYFVPLVWATSLVSRARKEGRIRDDFGVKTVLDELNLFRGQLGTLFNYDWISVPLVYTQTVTLSVYTFCLSCLMGRQFLDPSEVNKVDIYFPLFTLLQFTFYMGWLKVAESLINPFGEDDEDFDINNLIDRNLQVSYLIVDEMHLEHPQLIKDQYWDDIDFDLPYTAASEAFKSDPHVGSAVDISVKNKEAEFVQLPSVPEDSMLVQFMQQGEGRHPVTAPASIPISVSPASAHGKSIRGSRPSPRQSVQVGRALPKRQTSQISSSTVPYSETEEIFTLSDIDGDSRPGGRHGSRAGSARSTSSIMERVEMIDTATYNAAPSANDASEATPKVSQSDAEDAEESCLVKEDTALLFTNKA